VKVQMATLDTRDEILPSATLALVRVFILHIKMMEINTILINLTE
jgi:hypothetical protein